MPVDHTELINIVRELAEVRNLQVTIKESFKSACMAGSGAFIGGIVGGPIGIAIGGTLGSIFSAWNSSGKFKSVVSVIMEDMTAAQRIELANCLQRALQNVGIEDAIRLSALLMSNTSVQQLVITELTKYFSNELGLAIAS